VNEFVLIAYYTPPHAKILPDYICGFIILSSET
jgi:hypothetical protein